jgi:hypothetical protein
MKMPKIDDKLRLQGDFGETDGICVEVLKIQLLRKAFCSR